MPSYPIDQLSFHLPFDEPTGIHCYDDSPAGKVFTFVGNDIERFTGAYLYTGLWGYTGPYTFTGPSLCTGLSVGQGYTGASYIQGDTGTTGDISTGDFSLACWIRPRWSTQKALLNNYTICSKYPDEYFPYFEFAIEQDHWCCYVDFYTGFDNDALFTQSTHNMREDSWMHIAFTVKRNYDGITTKFYMNGILHNSSRAMGPNVPYNTKSLSNNGLFKIFKVEEEDFVEYGHHLITDLWFFNNHLLSDSEVWDLFKVLG